MAGAQRISKGLVMQQIWLLEMRTGMGPFELKSLPPYQEGQKLDYQLKVGDKIKYYATPLRRIMAYLEGINIGKTFIGRSENEGPD